MPSSSKSHMKPDGLPVEASELKATVPPTTIVVGLPVKAATGPGGGVAVFGSGRYSIWATALEPRSRSWPPKMTDRSGVIRRNLPRDLDGHQAARGIGASGNAAGHVDVGRGDGDHRPCRLVLDPADDPVRGLVAGLVLDVEGRRDRRLERTLAGGVVQGDVGVEDTTQVEGRGEEQQEDRQDERELDQALTERSVAMVRPEARRETVHE